MSDTRTYTVAGMTWDGCAGKVTAKVEQILGIRAWSGDTRLNPTRGLRERVTDPEVKKALDAAPVWMEPAIKNVEQRMGPVEQLV